MVGFVDRGSCRSECGTGMNHDLQNETRLEKKDLEDEEERKWNEEEEEEMLGSGGSGLPQATQ